jgi:hypothetical protein
MQRVLRPPRAGHHARSATLITIVAGCAVVATLLLSACGAMATRSIGGSAPQPIASSASKVPATPTTRVTHEPTPVSPVAFANTCMAARTGAIPPAAVMLPQKDGGTAIVKVGQTVGLDLTSTYHWTIRLDDPSHALTPISPQGALNPSSNTCDWRFLATAPGRVTLSVIGVYQCPPPRMCPALALDMSSTVSVQR